MVDLLENIFRCSVQGGKCHNALLKYVTGYVTKAPQIPKHVGGRQADSIWKQIYRTLCKRSPLEQEIHGRAIQNLSKLHGCINFQAPIPVLTTTDIYTTPFNSILANWYDHHEADQAQGEGRRARGPTQLQPGQRRRCCRNFSRSAASASSGSQPNDHQLLGMVLLL